MILDSVGRSKHFEAGREYHLYLDSGFSGYVSPHRHAFCQCVIVVNGRISQTCGTKTYSQLHGDVFFAPAACEHSLFVFDRDTYYYCLSFSEKILLGASRLVQGASPMRFSRPLFFKPNGKDYDLLVSNLDLLMRVPQHRSAGVYDWGYVQCTAALVLLWQAAESCFGQTEREESAVKEAEPSSTIADAVRYIAEHYDEEIKIDKLVSLCAMSRSSFYASFLRTVGTTPKQYITEKRMHEALRLIRDTDLPISKIAARIGYDDFSTFFRNFYNMTKEAPSDYRRRIQAKKQNTAF